MMRCIIQHFRWVFARYARRSATDHRTSGTSASVKIDGLTISFATNDYRPGSSSVQANIPVPGKDVALFYFEMFAESGYRAAVGLRRFPLDKTLRQYGTYAGQLCSFSYDFTGLIRSRCHSRRLRGFSEGAVVGCGMDFVEGCILFTRNG